MASIAAQMPKLVWNDSPVIIWSDSLELDKWDNSDGMTEADDTFHGKSDICAVV